MNQELLKVAQYLNSELKLSLGRESHMGSTILKEQKLKRRLTNLKGANGLAETNHKSQSKLRIAITLRSVKLS
jgi:hypothetical protein